MTFKKKIVKVVLVILLNILVYLVFRFFSERYSHEFISLLPNDDGLLVNATTQTDYYYLWQAFVWPLFSIVIGLINGYPICNIKNLKKKWLSLLLIYIIGIGFVSLFDSFISNILASETTGLVSWCKGFEGKVSLSLLSVIVWPITYLISLVFMCFWVRKYLVL